MIADAASIGGTADGSAAPEPARDEGPELATLDFGVGSAVPTRLPAVLAFTLVVFIVLFWRLGTPTFWDPDEAHYAETTREIVESGDWLAPYYNEQPFFDKPMLFHWLQATAMVVFGPTELAARIVPALAALALIGVTAWLGVELMSAETAVVAALLLSTNPALFALARYAILDTLFTLWLFGGAALVTISALQARPRLQWYGYVAIGLAVLTKGPLAFVLCGLTFGLTLLLSAEARPKLLGLHWVLGIVIALIVAMPWFLYMGWRFRDAFFDGYLFDENIRLFASDRYTPTASSSVWFYFRVLAAGLLPWTGLIVGRLYDDVRAWWRRDGSMPPIDVMLWSWTIAIVLFFTASKFKLDHYVFPTAPTLCLLGARAWVAVRERPTDATHRGARIGVRLVGPLLLVVSIVGGYFLIARLALPIAALTVPIAVGLAGAIVTLRVSVRAERLPAAPWAVVGALTFVFAGLGMWVLPALEQRKVVPDVARFVAGRATTTDRVATYRLNRWNTAFRFYVSRHVAMIDAPDQALALFNGREPFYCTMSGAAFDEFLERGARLRIVYEREGMSATSGRVLWRRQVPLTRFVVATRAE
jgi:4-amino-4-deoxy-L-arabinose transferase-like glycosyltransferase